jgi:hypothetical protein
MVRQASQSSELTDANHQEESVSNVLQASAVSAVYAPAAAIAAGHRGGEVAAYHGWGRRLMRRLYRFCDGLPRSHDDVDLEVLKRVLTPV